MTFLPPIRDDADPSDCICGRELGICDAHAWKLMNWRDQWGNNHINGIGLVLSDEVLQEARQCKQELRDGTL